MVVNITTNSRGLTTSGQKRFWKDPRDKYYYCFYVDNTDSYLKYKSSPDGVTWSAPVNASHAATGYDWFAIFFDGTYFWVAYQTGASAYPGSAATIWTRRGTVSAGTISLGSQVTVLASIGGYFGGNFCKTTGYVWLAFEACYSSGGYHIWVYNTTDGSIWTQKLNSTTMTDSGYHTVPQIASLEHVGTDQVMIVTGKYAPSTFLYKVWNGSAWGADTTFAEKKTNAYSSSWIRDLWAANGEVHFVYLYNGEGSAIRYRNYTTSWQNYATVDGNSDNNPSISNGADYLRVFYRRSAAPTVIYYREMNYTTHAFGGEQSFVSGEANTLTYPSTEKGNTAIYDSCAVTWQTGAAAPYNYRFASMAIVSAVVAPTVQTLPASDLGAES